MNKLVTFLIAGVLISGLYSCKTKPSIEYKYQDKPQIIDCPGLDKDLLHEALYSFEEDIANHYNFKNYHPGTFLFYQHGHMSFIYFGCVGEADFKKIVSPHTIEIFKELQKETSLWDLENSGSKLNYKHEFVTCLLSNFENQGIKSSIEALIETNTMSPKIMAHPLRRNISEANTNKYFAMYVALDAFYQQLFDVDLLQDLETN